MYLFQVFHWDTGLQTIIKQNIYNISLILKQLHLFTGLDVCKDEDMKGKMSSRLLTLGRVEGFSETRTAFIFWPSESCPSISTMWSSSFVLGSTQAWRRGWGKKAHQWCMIKVVRTKADELEDSGCFMCSWLLQVPNHAYECKDCVKCSSNSILKVICGTSEKL